VGRIEANNARYIGFQGERTVFEFPSEFHVPVALLGRKCIDKHNGYCRLTFDTPHKPKSTGPESSNNHAWGHARQIAVYVGDSPEQILRGACLETPDYPSEMTKLGTLKPLPWEEADSSQASAVIETLHRQAAFLNLKLKEE
jgi:hypothetical protein